MKIMDILVKDGVILDLASSTVHAADSNRDGMSDLFHKAPGYLRPLQIAYESPKASRSIQITLLSMLLPKP